MGSKQESRDFFLPIESEKELEVDIDVKTKGSAGALLESPHVLSV
jgi:hypothetical protein